MIALADKVIAIIHFYQSQPDGDAKLAAFVEAVRTYARTTGFAVFYDILDVLSEELSDLPSTDLDDYEALE